METQYRTRQGDLLDWLCWRHYGRIGGALEQVLAANPNLAAQGPVLPAGLSIRLPSLDRETSAATVLRLWD